MCYEVAIALAGGDSTTFTKSLIISLEDAAANWYSRLPHYASTLGNSTKKSSYSISRGSRRSSIQKKISCPALSEKRNTPQFLLEVLTVESLFSGGIRRPSHRSGHQSFAGGALA
jgi:hypothetical protein